MMSRALGIPLFSLLLCLAILRPAWASVSDDLVSCRCLEGLIDADDVDENLRRDAEELVQNYCEEALPLELVSGSERWLAEHSCTLLHESFTLDLEEALALLDEPSARRQVSVRIGTAYEGRRLSHAQFNTRRHNLVLSAQMIWELRPKRGGE